MRHGGTEADTSIPSFYLLCWLSSRSRDRKGDTVQWCRFGWSVSGGVEVGISTRWIKGCGPVGPVIFTLSDFNQALRDFNELRLRPLGSA